VTVVFTWCRSLVCATLPNRVENASRVRHPSCPLANQAWAILVNGPSSEGTLISFHNLNTITLRNTNGTREFPTRRATRMFVQKQPTTIQLLLIELHNKIHMLRSLRQVTGPLVQVSMLRKRLQLREHPAGWTAHKQSRAIHLNNPLRQLSVLLKIEIPSGPQVERLSCFQIKSGRSRCEFPWTENLSHIHS
jgi:hypothetical protein